MPVSTLSSLELLTCCLVQACSDAIYLALRSPRAPPLAALDIMQGRVAPPWWDERSASAGASGSTPLVAHVDLDCPYLRAVVLEALARRAAWRVIAPPASEDAEACSCPAAAVFSWSEYERLDWSRVLAGDLHASAYCIRKGLIRKSQFAYHVKKWAAKHPGSVLAKGVPETLLFEMWDADYLDEALADVYEVRDMKTDGSEWWILKPSMTNQARGILVFNQLESLKEALRADGADEVREWVLQRYINSPLLVGGHKFHLRMYALAVGALNVHVYADVLTLFSLERYTDDPSQLAAHLTNTCCQAPSGPEQHAAAVGLLADLPARIAAEGTLSLAEASARCDRVLQDSAALVSEAFAAVSAELAFMPLPNAFELFGMDLLVDSDWHVWLLEANAEPDFVQTGQALRSVIEGVVEGALSLSLDQMFPTGRESACAGSRYLKVFEREDPRATGCGMTFS